MEIYNDYLSKLEFKCSSKKSNQIMLKKTHKFKVAQHFSKKRITKVNLKSPKLISHFLQSFMMLKSANCRRENSFLKLKRRLKSINSLASLISSIITIIQTLNPALLYYSLILLLMLAIIVITLRTKQ